MRTPIKLSRFVRVLLLTSVTVATSLGCDTRNASTPLAFHTTPAHAARQSRTAQPRTSAVLSGVANAQALPDYQAAKRACAKGDFKGAARIMQQMQKLPGLTADERQFCAEQQKICESHFLPPTPAPTVSPKLASRHAANGMSGLGDCGPRALLIACEKLGVKTSLAELTRLAGTGRDGTSMAGLKAACESLKLKCEAMQVSREALADVKCPAVAFWGGNHWICVLEIKDKGESGSAVILDSNEPAPRTIGQETLLQGSSGILLTVAR